VMEPVDDVSIGERIAIYRGRRGLSQVALANLIGRSEAWVSQVERAIRHVDRLSIIIRLAQVLRVTVEELTGQPFSLAPNGGAEYRAIPGLRAALTGYEVIPATLGTLTRDDGPVRELTYLQRNADQANRLYQAAHCEEAGLLLSRLIGEAQRATRELPSDDHRATFGVLAQIYHITAKMGTSSFGPVSSTRRSASQWPPRAPLSPACGPPHGSTCRHGARSI
jgi:transcriptional regulator with XRE-family HTH domain